MRACARSSRPFGASVATVNMTLARRVLAAVAAAGWAGAAFVVAAGPAAALSPQPVEASSSLSVAQAVIIFGLVPLAVVGLVTALVMLPGSRARGGDQPPGQSLEPRLGDETGSSEPSGGERSEG